MFAIKKIFSFMLLFLFLKGAMKYKIKISTDIYE
jgi:hypothetical protein